MIQLADLGRLVSVEEAAAILRVLPADMNREIVEQAADGCVIELVVVGDRIAFVHAQPEVGGRVVVDQERAN